MDVKPEKLIERERRLAGYDGPDRVVASMELAETFAAQGHVEKSFQTGIAALDSAIDGFESGELIVISGPTSMGKTLLADTIVRNLRQKGEFSVFFTFEVTPQKFVRWHNSPESVVFLPQEHKSQDLLWLRDRCEEAKLKYGCGVVFIDHLHYLLDMASRNNISLEIGATMRFLKKEIALRLHMAVFVICHIKQVSVEEEPSIYHLRDSSFVGQEADTVLMVWRRFDRDVFGKSSDTMLQGLATIKIEKARRTGRIREKIRIRKDGICIVESLGEPEEEKPSRRHRMPAPTSLGGQDKASHAD